MYFPVFMDLSDKEILIAGAGTIALRRIRTLCGFAGHMTVIAPEITPEIETLARQWPITVCRRGYETGDLSGKYMVLAATDDAKLNADIAVQCKTRGILVNDCSDQAHCDFQFPSVVQDGEVIIGINASGRNHSLVKETRKRVEQCMPGCESRYESGPDKS